MIASACVLFVEVNLSALFIELRINVFHAVKALLPFFLGMRQDRIRGDLVPDQVIGPLEPPLART